MASEVDHPPLLTQRLCKPLITAPQQTKASASSPPANPKEDALPAVFTDTHGVITSTMNDIPGYRVVRVLGTIYGLTVRSRNL